MPCILHFLFVAFKKPLLHLVNNAPEGPAGCLGAITVRPLLDPDQNISTRQFRAEARPLHPTLSLGPLEREEPRVASTAFLRSNSGLYRLLRPDVHNSHQIPRSVPDPAPFRPRPTRSDAVPGPPIEIQLGRQRRNTASTGRLSPCSTDTDLGRLAS